MPVHPDPASFLLYGDDGTPLAALRLKDDDGERVAARVRPLPGIPASRVAAQARRDFAGMRLETPDDALLAAFVATGLEPRRAATEMIHDLSGLPAPRDLPDGWSLAEPGWDEDLAGAMAAAYGPDHPDGRFTEADRAYIGGMFATGEPVPPLVPASARLADPAGRSAGHILCAGPVPWTDYPCAWVLNLSVGPHAQGRGFGRDLLLHALHGTREAGLPALALSVVDGNPARRLYESAGFRTENRVLSVTLPAA
ncbi:GNAT family N-acetyltransferase [Actinoplanes oblitus]|uniref:GNAT family N-acetyltransferase n=1 Tax=Actinoplanes oblitus TaxID=3040509 RepID=A0ABY8W8C8_9ACTN|nr:GNAT family N-acetyltransferase [Actinoplanes oblitus]WIM94075.1 GNAT family N-acetyltransferase [Actinoplanes oblitus]